MPLGALAVDSSTESTVTCRAPLGVWILPVSAFEICTSTSLSGSYAPCTVIQTARLDVYCKKLFVANFDYYITIL